MLYHYDKPRIRLFVVDDSRVYLSTLLAMLSAEPDIEIVGTAQTGQSAARKVPRARPDVVLMDVRIRDIDGLGLAVRFSEDPSLLNTRLVLVSAQDNIDLESLKGGAPAIHATVRKSSGRDELLKTIHAAWESTRVAAAPPPFREGPRDSLVLAAIGTATKAARCLDRLHLLSKREKEILCLIAYGKSNGDIAELLFLSPATVKNHVTSIFDKMKFSDRAQATAIVWEMSLILKLSV